uniref:p-selectin n=1 Tax=Monodelphis domestica TaxID=13616 RepID=A0A5F8GAI4_MONDO
QVCYLEAYWHIRFQRTIFGTALISALISQVQVESWTYHYSDQKAYSWNASRKFCKTFYTDLVAIQNQNEIAYLNNFLPYYPHYYWIGIRKINNIWTWVGTNRTLTKEAENWAENEPNNKRNDQDCVEIYIKSPSSPGKWNDEPCMKRKRALCYQASCKPSSCNQHGECIETIGNYTCSCFPGFYGQECEYVIQCKELDYFPSNMLMTCNHPLGKFSYQSKCNFYCMEGYRLKGADLLQCSSSGEWTDEVPECSVIGCPALKSPERGKMICPYSSMENYRQSRCSFSCEEGFTLKGVEVIWCTVFGVWTAPVPRCEAVQCPNLNAPDGGVMNCIHSHAPFAYESTCEFSCQPTYRMSGLETLQCLASGQWTSPTPICHAITCDPLEVPAHVSFNCSSYPIQFQLNSECSFQCDKGFVLKGAEITKCDLSGIWTESVPVCHAKQCQDLRAPIKGHLSCSHPFGDFMYQSSCTLTCDEGFVPSESEELHCLDTGEWSSLPLLCEAITCKPLLAPQQGTMTCDHPFENYSYESTCQFSCNEGFSLVGPDKVKCTTSGHWTAHTPTCQAIKCPPLVAPHQGAFHCSGENGNMSYNSTCDFSCKSGLMIIGSHILKCTASGSWTSLAPSCKGKLSLCPVLDDPKWGNMECSYNERDSRDSTICHFTCDVGFVLKGSDSVQCSTYGNWTAPPPTCEVVKCPELILPKPMLMNCSHPWGNFSYESTCIFYCPTDQMLNGSPEIKCQAEGKWSKKMPTCQGNPLSIQEALTYFGGAVASVTSLVIGGSILVILRKRFRQKGKGEKIRALYSILMGTPGVFTNVAFDSIH